MSEYKEGDLVEAVNGETVVRWRAGEDNPLQMAAWEIELLYEVTVLESAPTPLPTEPGFYSDMEGDAWVLTRAGEWTCLTDQKLPVVTIPANPYDCAPFTRLEPVPETVTKVIDRVRELIDTGSMGTGSYAHLTSVLHIVELENGVRS